MFYMEKIPHFLHVKHYLVLRCKYITSIYYIDIYGYFLQSLIFIYNFFLLYSQRIFFYLDYILSSSKDFESIIFHITTYGNRFLISYYFLEINLLFQPRSRQLVKEKKKKGEKEKEKKFEIKLIHFNFSLKHWSFFFTTLGILSRFKESLLFFHAWELIKIIVSLCVFVIQGTNIRKTYIKTFSSFFLSSFEKIWYSKNWVENV